MSEQGSISPDKLEREQVSGSLLEAVRRATNIARGTKGIIKIEESRSYGTTSRSLELEEGPVYIRARSFVGADPAIHREGARNELLNVLAEVWGVGKMSCDIRNGMTEEISYIDANDPSKIWRNEHSPECEAEALALLELALDAVEQLA